MDSDSSIRLDPDVIDSGNVSQIPLSDLYGIPVFTEETDHKAAGRRMDRENALAHIRREVFVVRGCGEDEMLQGIRRQIFRVTHEHIMAETVEETEIFLEAKTSWGRPLTGILSTGILSTGILLTGIFILLLGLKKIRHLGNLG